MFFDGALIFWAARLGLPVSVTLKVPADANVSHGASACLKPESAPFRHAENTWRPLNAARLGKRGC